MGPIALGRTWAEASSPEAVRLARHFESAWRAGAGAGTGAGAKLDPAEFIPNDASESPGILLALLRADLALRRETGEPIGVEWYRSRYPGLDDEVLVALIYEEFCLREEAGETPNPAEYEARFPELASAMGVVLDIHGLVAEDPSTAPYQHGSDVAFPEAGRTIAGFRLVEELGRGSFARVFHAEEQELADRPVVLKVARLGTREPQTLARLQHTHIVPVHSYRIDPTTGLHLLCMPYFGRLTLAQALDDPGVKAAHTGAELVAALDRLQPAVDGPRSAGRVALARRTFPRAIAWWGERLAEALQHAHERGVLHRDVKPTNVLVTDDGLPMLLDFNLARDPWENGGIVSQERVGGTIAYMAPEHLEALLGRDTGRVDSRSDLYSLGLVLLEALGSPPMGELTETTRTADLPYRLLEARRSGPPRLRAGPRSIPLAFKAVLRRCLAPDPADRHASAAELAADLRAVADALPLRFTREPLASRVTGWVRRNRLRLAVAVPLVGVLVLFAFARFQAQAASLRRESMARRCFDRGVQSLSAGDCESAAAQFRDAAELAEGWPGLRDLRRDALAKERQSLETDRVRDEVDELGRRADPLRFHLLGFGGDRATASRDLEAALAPFGVLKDAAWSRRAEIDWLDGPRRERLFALVNELLFLWVVAVQSDRSDDPEMGRRAVWLCDRALAFAETRGPWEALRDWCRWRLGELDRPPTIPRETPRATSARACFQWALLATLRQDRVLALSWFERAKFLRPDDYWNQYALAYRFEQAGDVAGALQNYEAAVSLRPDAPWAWFNRAHLNAYRRGLWAIALRDLDRTISAAGELPADRVRFRLERGKIRQAIGDVLGARADYEAAIEADPDGRLARAARLDRARLDAGAGATRRARVAYDALVDSDPTDRTARLARARLALWQDRVDDAEADLSRLLRDGRDASPATRADWLASRAAARIALGRRDDADADAEAALRLHPGPDRVRLRARAALAAGREVDARLLHPDEIAGWPVGGPALEADLRAAIGRLGPAGAAPGGPTSHAARLARAALLSALGDHEDATAEADLAVGTSPTVESYTLRAEVRLRAGDRPAALADVERGLALDRDDPRLLGLRGRLSIEDGKYETGLGWLDRARFHGASGAVNAGRARALMALGRNEEAAEAWSAALAYDPEDPEAYLGRARSLRRLGLWENTLADLERAAERAVDQSSLFLRVTLEYLSCIPARPDRLPRVVGLVRRALLARLPKG